MLLESGCNGGFAGGRETCEPDCASPLLTELTALFASETCVPCDVPVAVLKNVLSHAIILSALTLPL